MKVIKTDKEYNNILIRIEEIIDAKQNTPEEDELELLSLLIDKYETEKFPLVEKPFTEEEEEVMNLLIEAHRKFSKIEQTHPSDKSNWINGIHSLQDILMTRVTRKDYPNYFKTIISKF